jgi:DNA modification methylase
MQATSKDRFSNDENGTMEWNRVVKSDALMGVQSLPDRLVQCCVTSPPYYRQRDYGMAGQWGQEESPDLYVDQLVRLFREVRRVLTDSGTLWLVIGDSYAGNRRGGRFHPKFRNKQGQEGPPVGVYPGIKRKDLLGIPWMVAFALRKDGWYLRQDIIWFKRNPMPESIRDRCSRSHEYIFMFSKRAKYYYNHLAIATPLSPSTVERMKQGIESQRGSKRAYGKKNGPMKTVVTQVDKDPKETFWVANRKSVWPIATAMSREDHFASFPSGIPELCIKAGTKEGDLVLDPFSGTGTTLLQASILDRCYLGFDLNPKYVGIARRRLRALEGIFSRE